MSEINTMPLQTILGSKVSMSEQFYNESVSEIQEKGKLTLQQGNQIQKDLWLHLVADGLVQPNDAKGFFAFGAFFRDYYNKHGKIAPYLSIVSFVSGY